MTAPFRPPGSGSGSGLSPVSRTAVGVARIRAAETRRPDGMFTDPLAAAFVEAFTASDDSAAAPAEPSPQRLALAFHVIVRTRYYDDYVLAATAAGCRQVVVLAAGLDARAFRLDWPAGTALYELDFPGLLEVKQQVLEGVGAQPRCARTIVGVDLREDWAAALAAAGWRRDEPTAWLAEGLLVYLEPEVAEQLLGTVTALSAPGSRLATERPRGARPVAADTRSVTDLWHGGGADPADWLSAHGWEVRVDDLGEVATRFGRPPRQPTDSGFVAATLGQDTIRIGKPRESRAPSPST